MPKQPDKDTMAKQDEMLAGFEFERIELPVLDRSTLENWATCPARAKAIADKLVVDASDAAASGQEAHDAISQMIADHVDSSGSLGPQDLRLSLENAAAASRPDVQPDVIRGLRASLWGISQFVARIHPHNVLRWDGGTGERSGQLAHDFKGMCRATAELDLVYAGPSPKLLHEVDWKTGNKPWTVGDVANSFQFQMHAFLLLSNYPDVDAVEIAVWDTRRNERSYPVVFDREHIGQWESRIRSAIGYWWQYRNSATPPTWPTQEKCATCPAIQICTAASADLKLIASDPRVGVQTLAFLETRVDALKKLLSAHVDKQGADIVCEDGTCFGRKKPASKRKPTAALYSTGGGEDE